MNWNRRLVLTGAAAAAIAGEAVLAAADSSARHGLIGNMRAKPGMRAQLIAILLEGTGAMPGCLSYVVAEDPADPDLIWITEVWTDAAAHQSSLQLPQVRAAIAKARPLIAGGASIARTRAAKGIGLGG